MCECGCIMGNTAYKLKAPTGWYIIEMQPGCDGCSIGPGIKVLHPETASFYYDEDMMRLPNLPTIGEFGEKISLIWCGPSRDEVGGLALKAFIGYPIEDGEVDKDTAVEMGRDLWLEGLGKAPTVVAEKIKLQEPK